MYSKKGGKRQEKGRKMYSKMSDFFYKCDICLLFIVYCLDCFLVVFIVFDL